MIAMPIIVPMTSHEQTVQNAGCPENKPYYIEVSNDAWKCADEIEYQKYKTGEDSIFVVFSIILMFVLLATILAIAVL